MKKEKKDCFVGTARRPEGTHSVIRANEKRFFAMIGYRSIKPLSFYISIFRKSYSLNFLFQLALITFKRSNLVLKISQSFTNAKRRIDTTGG
jgi:hypothetical protein